MSELQALGLATSLVFGLVVGGIYFAGMWWSAILFATGGRTRLVLALVAGRFALILAALGLVAIDGGALPLLVTGAGILIARTIAVKRVKAMAP